MPKIVHLALVKDIPSSEIAQLEKKKRNLFGKTEILN